MSLLLEHDCGDSLLKCVDCERQICPKCLVQCPVGNRCKECTKRFTSHLLKIDTGTLIRAFLSGMLVGFLFLLLQTFFPFGGFILWLLSYFVGTLAGNLVFNLSGRKIGKKIAVITGAAILIGNFFHLSIAMLLFLLGALAPFLGWNISWPSSRR